MIKVALVHDYLYTYGGAERVLEALTEIWPKAPIYTAWIDWAWLKKNCLFQHTIGSQKRQFFTSWFDKIPFKKQLCSPLRFLTPKIWSSFYQKLKDYEVIISSSAWYISKGVALGKKLDGSKKRQPIHICYCHTPPRYLYGYSTSFDFKKYWWIKAYAYLINPLMRYYDWQSSQAVDYFIANSFEVKKRIEKFYRREAEVIYPPIWIEKNQFLKVTKSKKRENYFLMVNRLVASKNIDLAIKACQKLKLNLKIVGIGPEEKRLKKIANRSAFVEFLGYIDDQKLGQLYSGCQAVLYLAQDEDFGITPVEAMSFGKPVIAVKSGGVKESILEGKTGFFIEKLDLNELIRELKRKRFLKIKKEDCFSQAQKFSKKNFKQKIKSFVEEKIKKEYH